VVVPTFKERGTSPNWCGGWMLPWPGFAWRRFCRRQFSDGTAAAVKEWPPGPRVRCLRRVDAAAWPGLHRRHAVQRRALFAGLSMRPAHDKSAARDAFQTAQRQAICRRHALRRRGLGGEFLESRGTICGWPTTAYDRWWAALSDPMSGFFMMRRGPPG